MFAFEVGELFMKSPTFGSVIHDLLERSSDPADRQVCQDALDLNCLWVDKIEAARKCAMIVNLSDVLKAHLCSGIHSGNEVAMVEIEAAVNELARRYPECFAEQRI
ncbi:hypothetical protein [Kibdelosporangium persicum]|nr:hypothetical protein [Kibdelosporangium persicum]